MLLEPDIHETVLGDGWRVNEGKGDDALAWWEIVVCDDAEAERAAGAEAWMQAEAAGGITRVSACLNHVSSKLK